MIPPPVTGEYEIDEQARQGSHAPAARRSRPVHGASAAHALHPLHAAPVSHASSAAFLLSFMIWANYNLIQNTFKWLTLALLAYIVSAILARPDIGAML